MRKDFLIAILTMALVLALPSLAGAKGAPRVTGAASLLAASTGAAAYLAVDAHAARGTAGTRGYRPAGGYFTWAQGGVTRDYACSAVTIANGKASLYGTSAEGLSMRVVIEDNGPGPSDVVRTGSGMLVTLWSVAGGGFAVR